MINTSDIPLIARLSSAAFAAYLVVPVIHTNLMLILSSMFLMIFVFWNGISRINNGIIAGIKTIVNDQIPAPTVAAPTVGVTFPSVPVISPTEALRRAKKLSRAQEAKTQDSDSDSRQIRAIIKAMKGTRHHRDSESDSDSRQVRAIIKAMKGTRHHRDSESDSDSHQVRAIIKAVKGTR